MRPDQLAHLTDEERRAWEELAGFFAAGLNIVVRRLNGSRKAAPMNRHMPGAERYLSAALEALADARRERDEWRNAAESAHLRGEGAAQMRDAADLAAALGDDRDPPRWEALLAIASRRTENARAAERERDEARAELANERGEGEPPSPGWEFVTQAGGAPLWRRLPRRHVLPFGRGAWQWWTFIDDARTRVFATGTAPTARAAMLAADAVVGGGE